MLVHVRVYDVYEWVPRHPGGSLIYLKAGGACSQPFGSYHPLSARWGLVTVHYHDLLCCAWMMGPVDGEPSGKSSPE